MARTQIVTESKKATASAKILLFALIAGLPTAAAATIATQSDSIFLAQIEKSLERIADKEYGAAWSIAYTATQESLMPIAYGDSDDDGDDAPIFPPAPVCQTVNGFLQFQCNGGWSNDPDCGLVVGNDQCI